MAFSENKEFWASFIELYKSLPCLWKIKDKKLYPNKDLKAQAYKKLVEKCNAINPAADTKYVKTKIESLKNGFRRELRLIRISKRTGSDFESVYIPTVWYYDLMLFLLDREELRSGISSIGEGKSEEDTEDDGSSHTPEPPKTPDSTLSTSSSSISKKTIKKPLSFNAKKAKFLEIATSALTSAPPRTGFEAFGEMVAKDMNSMDTMQSTIAQKLISDILYYDDDSESKLKMRHSFCTPRTPKHLPASDNCCKSDINFLKCRQIKRENIVNNLRNLGEYYKKFEHDEIPVKDSKSYDFADVGDQRSLTNSELDKLEMKIFKNISQELHTDDNSLTSLESNFKFFKTTVQQIFDNFYANMQDFELYKKRFYEILAKNDTEAVADMEDFIKDMIQHIMSSDTSISNESSRSCETKSSDHSKKSDDSLKNKETESSIQTSIHVEDTFTLTSLNKKSDIESLAPIVEAYKNEEYLTDSTLNEKKVNKAIGSAKEEVFNIYLLSGNPCVQIKMNDRNLLSEINIKEPSKSHEHGKQAASAENMIKVAAKKMELEKYVEQEQEECDVPDREIPVKVSCAKKNIYLNEDFSHDREYEKSFISKICNFLCRKFRKS